MEHLVCRLKKAPYGLKQAPRLWFKTLERDLQRIGFTSLEGVNCLFVLCKNGDIIYIIAYVDDVLFISRNASLLEWTKAELEKLYRMHDLGEVQIFLEIEITRDHVKGILSLTQEAYVEEILCKFGMRDFRPVITPGLTNHIDLDATACPNDIPYCEVIGSLIYLAVRTRPGIASAVVVCARKVENPTKSDWMETKRILRCLRGTSNFSLVLRLGRCEYQKLEGYSDADWEGTLMTEHL